MDDTVEPEGTREPVDDNDPERAFLTLASEVATMVARVEDLPKRLLETAPDYSADLGQLAKQVAAVNENLRVLRSFPYLSMTPQQHGEAIAQAGEALLAKASKEFDQAARIAHFEGEKLKSFLGHARDVRKQKTWLIRSTFGGLTAGFILFPLLAAILPFGLSESIASGIVGKDRWRAGQALMEAGDPQAFAALKEGNRLVILNEGKIRDCKDAARKAKKEQGCSVTVPVP